MNPVVIGGIVVAVGGPLLVSTFGFSDSCSSEITSKVVEYAPVVAGAIAVFFGHKNSVGKLRTQVSTLGAIPHA